MANFAWNNRDTSIERNGLLASAFIGQNDAIWKSAVVTDQLATPEPVIVGSAVGFAQSPVFVGLVPLSVKESFASPFRGVAITVVGLEATDRSQSMLSSAAEVFSLERGAISSLAKEQYTPLESTFIGARMAVIRDISRLKDGWDGLGSRAPSTSIKDDVSKVANFFPINSAEPSVEIDPEDGTVVLRWAKPLAKFSLTFVGTRSVTGFLLDAENKPAWKVGVSDFKALYSRLHDERVLQVMAK